MNEEGKIMIKVKVVRFQTDTYTNLVKYKSVVWKNPAVADTYTKRRK
jgi:hypothetical protein